MSPQNTRVIRSAVIVLLGLTFCVGSYWRFGARDTSFPHEQMVGYVDDGEGSADRYFVLVQRNGSELPWLIVSQRFRNLSEIKPYTLETSSTKDAVMVNGNSYKEIEGMTTIVLSGFAGSAVHNVPREQSPTIEQLGSDMQDVRVADFETLLPRLSISD